MKPTLGDRIPYLDGLRGYSILTVIGLHAAFQAHGQRWLIPVELLFANGRLGVDLFFVLSGFLIQTLLLAEWERTSTISLRKFYLRRVARIFPATYAYVGTIGLLTAIGWTHLGWRPIAVASTFTWNYTSLFHFFRLNERTDLLNHFWTLSLEEQFYLVWPGLLLLAGRDRARVVAIACLFLVPVLRIASYFLMPAANDQLEGMFHTSCDEILWGVVAAYAFQGSELPGWLKNGGIKWAAIAGGIAGMVLLPLLSERFGGLNRFVVPTVNCAFGVTIILWLLTGTGGFLRQALSMPVLAWLGRLSFSLYLWQQLFFAPESPIRAPFPINLGLALGAAVVSYYFIEAPLRLRIRSAFSQ